MPATCRYYGSQQIGELTETNWSRRLTEQTTLRRCPALGQQIEFFRFSFPLQVRKYLLDHRRIFDTCENLPRDRGPAHERIECFGCSEALGITLTAPPHVSQVVISMLTMQVQRSTTSSTEITARFQLLIIFARCLTLCYI